MQSELNLLAFDIGASNGRCILGRFDGNKINMSEVHRFENGYVELSGVMYWNVLELYRQMKLSFSKFKLNEAADIDSFGIDTWGVDYGLIDKNGQLTGLPRSYRLCTEEDVKSVDKAVPLSKIYERTGEAPEVYTTLCQLYRRHLEKDTALKTADKMLMMPDLLGYFFTGIKQTEYTIATTTMMYDPHQRDWDRKTLSQLGVDSSILTSIDMPGQKRGRLSKSIADELGVNRAYFSTVGSHDTASAVAAIPGKENFAFCSSGTWSLIGVETDNAVINENMFNSGFSNEGTVQGGYRTLKSIMGLWHIQECRRDWARCGNSMSWNEIVAAASQAKPLRHIIDTDSADFYAGGNMENKIQNFLLKTGQPATGCPGETARCIYESLALKYRWSLEKLENIKGEKIEALNIVGGGIQNKLLNQMIADSIGLPVITGPIEGAAIGNLLTQAMALGEVSGIDELRQVVRNSVEVEVYEPHHSDIWDEAYEKLITFIK